MVVRLLRSHQWTYDQLMAHARAPDAYTWAGPDDQADITIYIVPPVPEPGLRAPLRMVGLRDFGRLYLFSQEDDGWFWAPGLFTAANEACPPGIAGGFYIYPDQSTPGFAGPLIEAGRHRVPDLLWSFVGDVRTHPTVRGALVALDDPRAEARYAITPDQMATDERMQLQAAYAETLTRSMFGVCPLGFSPTSRRFFEVLRAGRAPVVISDAWRPPALIDWDDCVVRIREREVRHLPQILREHEADASALGMKAREVWERHFSPPEMVHYIVKTCLAIDATRQTKARRLALAVKSVPTVGARRRLGAVVRESIAEARRLGRP